MKLYKSLQKLASVMCIICFLLFGISFLKLSLLVTFSLSCPAVAASPHEPAALPATAPATTTSPTGRDWQLDARTSASVRAANRQQPHGSNSSPDCSSHGPHRGPPATATNESTSLECHRCGNCRHHVKSRHDHRFPAVVWFPWRFYLTYLQ